MSHSERLAKLANPETSPALSLALLVERFAVLQGQVERLGGLVEHQARAQEAIVRVVAEHIGDQK